jgi:predicted RNA-binding protein with PIN domain
MPLLIDGYNLLHASSVFATGRGGPTLERTRNALLVFLSESLPHDERPVTTIVFDAKNAPPGLPRQTAFCGIKVHFAAAHAEADDLIEELIRAETSPRQLTVVSSDHRIQRAARRRKATAVDSEQWYATILRQSHERAQDKESDFAKPTLPLDEKDVESWLRKFGDIELTLEDPGGGNEPTSAKKNEKESREQDLDLEASDDWNPFPPGYAEDLLDEDSER